MRINEAILDKIPGDERIYYSVDSVDLEEESDPTNYCTEFLNSLTPSGMPPHRLRLKLGCIVVLLRNMNPAIGLCNGTRLQVRAFHQRAIVCTPLHSPHRTVILPRIDLAPTDSTCPFTLRRRQFPIRLAYSMTINKSQGQTFDQIGIYLPTPVFTHGQLYVALSRVRSSNNIKVFLENTSEQGRHPQFNNVFYTKNIVYNEVLN